jgi:hypothetical protein
MSMRSMLGLLGMYAAFAGDFLSDIEEGHKRAKDAFPDRWKRMLAMPRKKKKQEKKRLEKLALILSYDPMEEIMGRR